MKKIIFFIFVAGLISFNCTLSYAFSIIQDFSDGDVSIKLFQPGQSFTAEDSRIDIIGAYVWDRNDRGQDDNTIDFFLYEGNGIMMQDALIISQEITLPDGFSGYADVDVSSYVFNVGSQYTFFLDNNVARWDVELTWNTDPYSGGGIWWDTRGPFFKGNDLRFHVLLPDPVPEPTTIALLGIGLVGLAYTEVRRRRKKKAVDNS